MSENSPKETELERRLRQRAEAEDREAAARATSVVGDLPGNPSASPASDRVSELEAECAQLQDQLLRARAEFENYRKRNTREVERIRRTAAESLIHDLLVVMDNLELAIRNSGREDDALTEGVRLVHKQFMDTLARNGLEPIEAVGRPFDPNVHEAVAIADSSETGPGHVIEEFQRGYRLGGQILRPSKVLVSRRDDAAAGA
jgi:molecular chaperone GrpE